MELFADSKSNGDSRQQSEPEGNTFHHQTHGFPSVMASEFACEGQFVEEATLPVDQRNGDAAKRPRDMFPILADEAPTLCRDYFPESPQVPVHRVESPLGQGKDAEPLYEGSFGADVDVQLDQDQAGYETDRSMDADFSPEENFSTPIQKHRSLTEHTTAAKVLDGLDCILRDRVNQEVEDFRQNLQSLLDEQQNRMHHLIQLSADRNLQQERLESSQVAEQSVMAASAMEDDDKNIHDGAKCEAEMVKFRNLTTLLTYSSVISATLRKREFQLV